MTNRIMGDSTDLAEIPLSVAIVATYLNGHIGVSTPEQLEARFPHARYGHVWIDVTGANADKASVLDVENGDATPAVANLWVQSFRKLRPGQLPVIYCNRSNMAPVIADCASGGNRPGYEYGLWVATLDGTEIPHRQGDGIVACQVKGANLTGGSWDESVVYDGSIWLPSSPPPVTRAEAQAALAVLGKYVAQ